MRVKRVEVLDVPVDDVTMDSSVIFAKEAIQLGRQVTIVAVNPEKIISARHDEALRLFLQQGDLLIPDGIGAVIAAKLNGASSIARVPGAELMPKLCEMAEIEDFSVFLLGAKESVNAKAVDALLQMYPKLKVVGRNNGYFDEQQELSVVEKINQSGAHLLFIALGSPRQEEFMRKYKNTLEVKVIQGVGGTFDVLAGEVKRAPEIMRKLNLEWLARLVSQPKRILRQTALPKFAILVLSRYLFNR